MSNRQVFCTVCNEAQSKFILYSDAPILACEACSHVFTDTFSLVEEDYGPEYYEKTHKKWFDNPDTKFFGKLFKLFPKETRSVLDVGCGNGNFLRYLEKKSVAIDRLVGIDLRHNNSTNRIQYINGELKEMVGNEQFDVVISLAVIEHVADPIEFALGLSKKCKPGGHIIVMTVASDSLIYAIARAAYKVGLVTPAKRLYSAHHLQHFTKKSLQTTLETSGLTITKKFLHTPPLKAVDVPMGGWIKQKIFYIGLITCYFFQAFLGKQYLQTQIYTKSKLEN
ncbi:MAG: class I SAM-dependent methyltransferase [Legionellaceae bacterium]|nr:class I SAM-dependent methyltransferase [Legionellaceae bacterium]